MATCSERCRCHSARSSSDLSLQLTKLFLVAMSLRWHALIVSSLRLPESKTVSPDVATVADITVVQPILSGDPLLAETLQYNLKSLAQTVRFLWLIDVKDEIGLETAIKIAPYAKFRTIDTEKNCRQPIRNEPVADEPYVAEPNTRVCILLCPEASANRNPKSFKLKLALQFVSTRYFAVVDDDTTLENESLETAIEMLQLVDLYTGLPSYHRGHSAASDMVAHFVNNNSVLTYLPPTTLFPPISLNGMFYVARSETLCRIGGFAAIESDLCDDYALSRLLRRHGTTVYQGITRQAIATTVNGSRHYEAGHRHASAAIL